MAARRQGRDQTAQPCFRRGRAGELVNVVKDINKIAGQGFGKMIADQRGEFAGAVAIGRSKCLMSGVTALRASMA